jgi:hypothetical protein
MLTRGALQQGRKFFLMTSPPPPPPPSPKKFRSVYHFRGPKIFRTYQNFSRIDTNFSKFAEFVPFFFIIIQYCRTVKRILLNVFGILFFVCRQIPSFADNSFSGGVSHPPHPPYRYGPDWGCHTLPHTHNPGRSRPCSPKVS